MTSSLNYGSSGGPLFVDSEFKGNVSFGEARPVQRPSTLPRSINRLFTGREEIGAKLAESFSANESTNPVAEIPRRFVISGLGGTGKSEVCIKYAFDHRSEYWGIFWIDCTNENTTLASFKDIGRLCRIEDPDISNVKHVLSSINERWLLIVDNADDFKFDYSAYFPSGGSGDIIITTRNPSLCKKYATVGSENLSQLEKPLARELLLRSADIPEHDWTIKEDCATNIVDELGRHTLAIVHAGAFIEKYCTIEEYLEEYKKHQETLFSYERDQEISDYKTVHLTFEVSMEKLNELKSAGDVAAADALELIALLAFFHNEGELQPIMEDARSYATEIENNSDQSSFFSFSHMHFRELPDFLPNVNGGIKGRRRWQNACRVLEDLSLIVVQRLENPGNFSMHPLVHRWAFERHNLVQTNQNALAAQSQTWFKASLILALCCRGELSYQSVFERILSHAQACLNHPVCLYIENLQDPGVLPTVWQLIHLQCVMFEDFNLLNLVDTVQTIITERCDVDQSTKQLAQLQVRVQRGLILVRQRKYSEASNELKQVVSEYEEIVAESHWHLNYARLTLADAYTRTGQTEAAIKLLKRIIDAHDSLDLNHSHLLQAQVGLAYAYNKEGRNSEAIELLKQVVSVQQSRDKSSQRSILIAQHHLADIYYKAGQLEEALALIEHVVDMEKDLPKDTYNRLESQHLLARICHYDGQVSRSIELFEYVVAIRKKRLAIDHPVLLITQHDLAKAYHTDNQIERAIGLMSHVVSIQRETLPADHPHRMISERALRDIAEEAEISEGLESL